jgi:hypothetical protein
MRALLRQHDLTYRALAARTHYSPGYLHDLATGRKSPTPRTAERIDAALGANGELARLAAATERITDDMQRRAFVAALVGLGLGSLVDQVGVPASLTGTGPGALAGVDDWHETVHEYGYTYLSAPRAELLADLCGDLTAVLALIPHASDQTVRGLSEAAGRLAGLLAMVCTDLGLGREARRAWQVARHLADQSGSASAAIWVRGNEAVLGLYSHRPLPVVLDLADRGLARSQGAAVGGVVNLASARAQTLALMGRQTEAATALHTVEDAFGQLPAETTGLTESIFGFPEHLVRHTESFVHSLSGGATSPAYAAQDRALAGYTTSKPIGRGQVQPHRAACLVRDGDLAGGVGHAVATLQALPGHARGRLVLTVAEAVLTAVPPGQRDRGDAADYAHLLTTLRTPVAS